MAKKKTSIFDFDTPPVEGLPANAKEILKKNRPVESEIKDLLAKNIQTIFENMETEHAIMPIVGTLALHKMTYRQGMDNPIHVDVENALKMPVSAKRFGKNEVVTAQQFIVLLLMERAFAMNDKAAIAMLINWSNQVAEKVPVNLSDINQHRTVEIDQTTLQTMQMMGINPDEAAKFKNVTVIEHE